MTADLRKLWQEAFGDSAETLDRFAATGFCQDRYHCICNGDAPVSALYWFDCELDGKKLAYIYAVATRASHRGQGLAQQLMAETHEILKKQGYAGAILVPGEKGLFDFYKKIGYQTVTSVNEFVCEAAGQPVTLREIGTEEYAQLRRAYLPAGGVVQEGAALDWLHSYTTFYAGEDFLFSAAGEGSHLLVQEFLGNTARAEGILTTLGMGAGRFRTPGKGQAFAMYLPFTADCPNPSYFGLALD
jgi:GNAT superfamily N-acetyltransferase